MISHYFLSLKKNEAVINAAQKKKKKKRKKAKLQIHEKSRHLKCAGY